MAFLTHSLETGFQQLTVELDLSLMDLLENRLLFNEELLVFEPLLIVTLELWSFFAKKLIGESIKPLQSLLRGSLDILEVN